MHGSFEHEKKTLWIYMIETMYTGFGGELNTQGTHTIAFYH
jgi:hypothetical protein